MEIGNKVIWNRMEGQFVVIDMVLTDPEIVLIESEGATQWYADIDELTIVPADTTTVKEKAFGNLVKACEMYLAHEPDRAVLVKEMFDEVDALGHMG